MTATIRSVKTALTAPGGQRITVATVTNPAQLAQALQSLQASVNASTQASRSSPGTATQTIRNVAVTCSTTLILRHGLGRPFTGYFVTRSYPGADPPSFVELPFTSYPGGLNASTTLCLVPYCQGRYDIRIEAD